MATTIEPGKVHADLLRKYLTKYQVWGADDSKVADFRDAQQYYNQAIEALGDYDKVDSEAVEVKQTILFTGTAVAMRAVDAFENVIVKYAEEFKANKANVGKQFIIPGTEDSETSRKLDSFRNLTKNIRTLTPELDLWLKKFALTQKVPGAAEVEHWEDVKITERGLRIYHLKSLIDYCEIMIKGINVLAADNHIEVNYAKDINFFFEKGSGCLTSLLMLYDNLNLSRADATQFTTEQFTSYCRRCTNMFKHLMSALVLIGVSTDTDEKNKNITAAELKDMEPDTIAALLLQYKQFRSADMINEFEDNLLRLFIVRDTSDVCDFEQPSKLIAIMSRALEIGQQMKIDITNSIGEAI